MEVGLMKVIVFAIKNWFHFLENGNAMLDISCRENSFFSQKAKKQFSRFIELPKDNTRRASE